MERNKRVVLEEMRAEQAVISLIAGYLHGQKVDKIIYRDIGVSTLFSIAKRWSMEVLVWDALQAQQIFQQEEGKAWFERRQRLQMLSLVQQSEAQSLKKMFVDQGIHVLPLKGYYLKGMYPRPEQRQMCDLDFLLEEQEMEQARQLMEGRGYVTEHFQESNHDNYRKKPFLYVELHRRLLAEDSPYAPGLGDMLRRAVRCPDGAYEVSWTDFYLFLLVHFAKHMEWAGCGPRSVLDVYLFRRAHGAELDEAYLHDRLTDMGMEGFSHTVEQLAECWFAPHREDLTLSDPARVMAREILDSGVYGTWSQVEEHLLREHRGARDSVERAGLRFLWSCVFLPRKKMEIMYPMLRRYPAMLPACWLMRGGRMVFATPVRSWRHCRAIWRTVQRVKNKEQNAEA